MDLNDVERITFNALGGADNINIHDLSGTDVTNVDINLAASSGGGDSSVDTITLDATNADDVISVSGANGSITVTGLSATVTITGFEATDRLVINGLGGNDVIDASALSAAILLTGNGGEGDDLLLGGIGTDVLDGGTGANTIVQ